jgi:hypothetical protein
MCHITFSSEVIRQVCKSSDLGSFLEDLCSQLRHSENPSTLVRFEPANLGSQGKHIIEIVFKIQYPLCDAIRKIKLFTVQFKLHENYPENHITGN